MYLCVHQHQHLTLCQWIDHCIDINVIIRTMLMHTLTLTVVMTKFKLIVFKVNVLSVYRTEVRDVSDLHNVPLQRIYFCRLHRSAGGWLPVWVYRGILWYVCRPCRPVIYCWLVQNVRMDDYHCFYWVNSNHNCPYQNTQVVIVHTVVLVHSENLCCKYTICTCVAVLTLSVANWRTSYQLRKILAWSLRFWISKTINPSIHIQLSYW